MNEIDSAASKPSRLVKCEQHGLHYDPEKMSGCVICRREAGGSAPRATPIGYGNGASATSAGAPSGLGLHLGIAAALCLAGGFALFSAHSAISAVLGGSAVGGASFEESMEFDPNALPEGQMGEALRELGADDPPVDPNAEGSDTALEPEPYAEGEDDGQE
jgi:hypothetical protein